MEYLITKALCMHDYSPLSLRPKQVILPIIFRGVLLLCSYDLLIVLVVNFSNHLKRLETARFLDSDDPPVVETTFPKLSKVNGYLSLEVFRGDYVSLVYLMPRQN
jgi:hypothetical protein